MPKVYTITKCEACEELRAFLDQEGIPYEYANVEKDPKAMEEFKALVEKEGKPELYPTFEHEGKIVLQGFGGTEAEKRRIREAVGRPPERPLDIFAWRRVAIRDTNVPPGIRSALAADEYLGRVPLSDFSRLWNSFIYAFCSRRWGEALYCLDQAEGLAEVLVSDYGEDFTALEELFAVARAILKRRLSEEKASDFGTVASLREIAQLITLKLERVGIGIAPIL